mmetsp:Transcript_52222/g.113905  ORF Transcript_52222/g.113905 Transcript_52222/m.113905 type:complete len:215 (-) Transcript_52222:472-1116(-)
MLSMTSAACSCVDICCCCRIYLTDLLAKSRSTRKTKFSSGSARTRLLHRYMVSRVCSTCILRKNSACVKCFQFMRMLSMYTQTCLIIFRLAAHESSKCRVFRAFFDARAMSAIGLNSRTTISMCCTAASGSSSSAKRSADHRTKLFNRLISNSDCWIFLRCLRLSRHVPTSMPTKAPKMPPAAMPIGPNGIDMIAMRPPPKTAALPLTRCIDLS